MDERYQIAKVGETYKGGGHEDSVFVAELTDRLQTLTPPYERRVGGDEWGFPMAKARDAAKGVQGALDRHDVGVQVRVRGSVPGERRFRTRRIIVREGPEVLAAALSQLGVDYSWGGSNPEGPAGGAGSGFDCSGFTKWCYWQVGVGLPHSAEAQRTDARVVNFDERRKARSGDLVFYDASSRLSPGQADHVGIYDGRGGVVDASSSADAIVHRSVDANPIIGFGRLVVVNGPV